MTNLIIKFGFQSIKPNFLFTNNKGQLLYESNHVFGVQELRLIDGLSIITGFVIRQASITLDPYKVQLEVIKKNFLKFKFWYPVFIILT